MEISSRHREPLRLAAAGHLDRGKAGYREAAGAAVALFVDLELALAGAKLFGAAPVQRLVLELQRAGFRVHCFPETENLLWLTGNVGMQALAWVAAIPPAAAPRLAV